MTTAAKIPRPARMLEGLPPDTRVIIGDVTWKFYDRFSDPVRKGENCRVAFDGKDVEIMGIGPLHDWILSLLTVFVEIVSEDLKIECIPMGSTTWKREQIKRGIESDQCYYFDPAKIAAAGLAVADGPLLIADLVAGQLTGHDARGTDGTAGSTAAFLSGGAVSMTARRLRRGRHSSSTGPAALRPVCI